jgi:hypothetical protein
MCWSTPAMAYIHERPQKISQPVKRIVKDKAKKVYLNHPWGMDVDSQIRALKGGVDFCEGGSVSPELRARVL